jgi:hypothetical protein
MAKELIRAPESLSVWESNMKELRAHQPYLALLLHQYVTEHGHSFAHFENGTPAGKWVDGLTGEPFFERGAEPEFNWSAKRREDKNKPVFMLYGTGTPPYLFKAIRALPEAALSLIVVEPNIELIAYTLHLTHVYLALPQKCRMAFITEGAGTGDTEQELRDSKFLNSQKLMEEGLDCTLRRIGIYSAALSEISGHDGEMDVWRETFTEIGKGIREWVAVNLSNLGNSAEDTLLGLRQIALMSPQIVYGAPLGLIHRKFSGRPAVVVAAGPSLDKNFMLLKDIQDKCVIIAADAVLEKLLSNGIKPHIVTSLERVLPTYDLFFSKTVEEYREECRDILLVAQALCVPWTSGRWPGPVCLVFKKDVVSDSWIGGGVLGGSPLVSGLSVAHMNYSIADYIGASSIAIIGQDLAYGEDGASHAGNVGGSFSMSSRGDALEIPGALGGAVRTTRIWLSFLRLLETLIRQYQRPTWDCTEGGALIAFTKILPFADFIEEQISGLEPMEETPAGIARDSFNPSDRGEIRERVLKNIKGQYSQFDVLEGELAGVERIMEDTAAAGLEPARRIMYATRAGNKLDNIHSRSPVFDFIGQSYTRLASIELSLTRSLDDVEMVNRWYDMHREIIDSHRALVAFVRKWLSYAERAVDYWGASEKFEMEPLDPDEARRMADELFARLSSAEGEDIVSIRLELDNVMMRCDPVLLKWPGRVLWGYAMLLMTEGRAALATRFMDAAAADFDGSEMPVSEMALFFKDYARVLMGHDLTHMPDYFKAETMLANAVDLNGVDDDVKSILDELLDSEISHNTIIDEIFSRAKGQSTAGWFSERAAAQEALYGGDLKKALFAVWNAVLKYHGVVPGWVASHLDWLVRTLDKCLDAPDPLLSETVGRIASEMVSNIELLSRFRVGMSARFIELLKDKGLPMSMLPPSEPNEPDKPAEGENDEPEEAGGTDETGEAGETEEAEDSEAEREAEDVELEAGR